MRHFVWLSGTLLFILSCGNHETKEMKAVPAIDSSAMVYYPINDYIRRQIKDVDTTPYYLYRLQVLNGKKDSSAVSRPAFDSAVSVFLLPELDFRSMRKNFTESVFDDESTNSITLTYTPNDKNETVQNASVLLSKENQSVKWIFISILTSSEDSTVIQRISWKGDESCSLNTSVTYNDKRPEQQRQLSFVWNEKKEE